jgi:hypothetical protein
MAGYVPNPEFPNKKEPTIINVGEGGGDQFHWVAPGVPWPNDKEFNAGVVGGDPSAVDPKQTMVDQGTAGGSAYSTPRQAARRDAINQLFPGIGVSRFLNTLGANETDTQDRYGSSPLFSTLMLQGQKQQAPTPERAQPQDTGLTPMQPQVDVAGSAYNPMVDAGDFTRSRRTGGVNPYRRQAMNALFGS